MKQLDHGLDIETDPDGLIKDRSEIISDKLVTPDGFLTIPTVLQNYSTNIAILPHVSIFDISNYLVSYLEYSHATD